MKYIFRFIGFLVYCIMVVLAIIALAILNILTVVWFLNFRHTFKFSKVAFSVKVDELHYGDFPENQYYNNPWHYLIGKVTIIKKLDTDGTKTRLPFKYFF